MYISNIVWLENCCYYGKLLLFDNSKVKNIASGQYFVKTLLYKKKKTNCYTVYNICIKNILVQWYSRE